MTVEKKTEAEIEDSRRELNQLVSLVTKLGLSMVVSILFFFSVGLYLDRWLHLKGIFTVLFLFFGLGIGFYYMYFQISKVMNSERGGGDGKEF